jgi:hypothetical protein
MKLQEARFCQPLRISGRLEKAISLLDKRHQLTYTLSFNVQLRTVVIESLDGRSPDIHVPAENVYQMIVSPGEGRKTKVKNTKRRVTRAPKAQVVSPGKTTVG